MQPPVIRRIDPTFPNLGFSVLIVCGFIGVQVVCLVPVLVYALVVADFASFVPIVMNPWVLGTVNTISAAVVLALCLRRTGESAAQFFAVRPVSPHFIAPAVVTAIGLGLVLDQIDTLLVDVLRRLSIEMEDPLHLETLARSPLGTVLTLVVVAPITEEYLMRGMVLRGLLRRYAPAVAIFVSAVFFGLMHANLRQFIVGLVVGGAFGWWYHRTASVALPLLGHAVFNAIPTLFLLFPDAGLPLGHYAEDGSVVYQPWWLTFGGVCAVGVGILWFRSIADVLPRPEKPWEIPVEPPLLPQAGSSEPAAPGYPEPGREPVA